MKSIASQLEGGGRSGGLTLVGDRLALGEPGEVGAEELLGARVAAADHALRAFKSIDWNRREVSISKKLDTFLKVF